MEFHLNYTPPRSLIDITHEDKILMIGSCFSESIGERFKDSKFKNLVNPNGILFNPIPIANAIHSYMKNDTDVKIGNNNGLYFSYDHHGSFSKNTEKELISEVLTSRQQAHQFLKEAKFLIITFGSAYVYHHIPTNHMVANCHKLPHNDFIKRPLSVDDITSAFQGLINDLRDFNPDLKIIFTVSPVKYLRDGIINNNLSKAILIQSVHNMVSATSNPKSTLLNYFPAYELVNDDLRDYRFYKADMAHPNEQAVDYIWEKFSDVYFNDETKQLLKKIKDVRLAVNHRPLKENSTQHKEFKTSLLKKCDEMEKSFPFLSFSEEKEQLINQ